MPKGVRGFREQTLMVVPSPRSILLDLSTGEECLVSNRVPPLVLPLVDQALVS